MLRVIAVAGSDWSLTGSILTFAFPVFLFVAVGATLWVLYTMPHEVPGLRYRPERGAVRPATDQQPQPGPGEGRQAAGDGAEG